MKLFVWDNVLWDYGPGIAFAMAETVEDARSILLAKYSAESSSEYDDWKVSEDVKQGINEDLRLRIDTFDAEIAVAPTIVYDGAGCGFLSGSS